MGKRGNEGVHRGLWEYQDGVGMGRGVAVLYIIRKITIDVLTHKKEQPIRERIDSNYRKGSISINHDPKEKRI